MMTGSNPARSTIVLIFYIAPGLSLLLLGAAAWVLPASAELLEWQRDGIGKGQWWRLLTGHWVHLSIPHLLLNLGGLALLPFLFDRQPGARWLITYLLTAPILISLGLLWAAPNLGWYRGFSGCLHGLFVLAAMANLRHQRFYSLLVLVLITAKLLAENLLPGLSEPTAGMIGGRVIAESHWLGALTGVIAGLFMLMRQAPEPPSPE